MLTANIYATLFTLCFSSIVTFAQAKENCQTLNNQSDMEIDAVNVFGESLKSCCTDPLTGFYRNGQCQTGPMDYGTHIACARMTQEFLIFSRKLGNDLITPRPEFNFPGLKAGDYWCLCISRWKEALDAGVAPPLNLSATHIKALDYVDIKTLVLYDVLKYN